MKPTESFTFKQSHVRIGAQTKAATNTIRECNIAENLEKTNHRLTSDYNTSTMNTIHHLIRSIRARFGSRHFSSGLRTCPRDKDKKHKKLLKERGGNDRAPAAAGVFLANASTKTHLLLLVWSRGLGPEISVVCRRDRGRKSHFSRV